MEPRPGRHPYTLMKRHVQCDIVKLKNRSCVFKFNQWGSGKIYCNQRLK
jgi:hypothetical protein